MKTVQRNPDAPLFTPASIRASFLGTLGLCMVIILALPALSWGHGFAGKRFFPTTFQVEDAFVSDEFSLLFNRIKGPGEGEQPPAKTTAISLDYAKRITQNLGFSVGGQYQHLSFNGEDSKSGFGNLELGLKYQLLTSEKHEMILSLGLGVEVGGTGARGIGSESFSVISPTLFFAKGLGDLPDSMGFLRPFAITGAIGPNIPTRSKNVTLNLETGEEEAERNPTTLSWGFTLQYSLMYLQSFVKDVGLGDPFRRMVLVVEFPMETCMNSGCGGKTTGTINPGIVWAGKSVELGLAAQIPINSRSGRNVGILGLVHLFIDDLFPKSIGRPIFP